MEEIWKDIPDYEGLYQVSNFGRIRSIIHTTLIMRQAVSGCGYYHIRLYKDKKYKTLLVHRLVASAFLPNPENKPQVNHIDANKLNNHIDNLEWVTISENQRHAISLNLRPESPMIGRKCANCPSSIPILQYDVFGNFIKQWPSATEAARSLNILSNAISACLHGKNKTSYGFIWRYYDGKDIPLKIESVRDNRYSYKTPKPAHKIQQFSKDGTFIKEWDSCYSINIGLKYDPSKIYACAKGKRKSAYGFIWKYSM